MGSFSALHWVIVTVIVLVIVKAIRDNSGSGSVKIDGNMICPSCGTCGDPITVTRGNIAIEIILWLCLLIPGLIYSIWRLTTRSEACPACGQMGMIPADSPNGKRLAKQYESQ